MATEAERAIAWREAVDRREANDRRLAAMLKGDKASRRDLRDRWWALSEALAVRRRHAKEKMT